ncbi:MAG: hypothetical protein JOZ43_01425 [Acidobacteriales bacterium]|nr:hypothetical protein [Terriglobales bacterium]
MSWSRSLLVCALALPLTAQEHHLVTAQWLSNHLRDPNLIVIDTSPETYTKGHIPGAVGANIYELFAYGFGDQSADKIEKRFQSWGISPGKRIVIYDKGGDNTATRLFFDLDYHGFPERDLFLLDGGLAKWQQQGLPVTTEATPTPALGSFKLTSVNDEIRVGLPEFLTGSGDPAHYALVEGLDPTWHYGAVAPFDRPGHPPNGILASGDDFYNPDKTFKSPDDIKRMLLYLGIRPEQQLYTYCGGGVAATIPFFAAKYIAEYPRVKVYPESELGWLSDQRQLPYWTYDAPYLIRNAAWVQWWNNPMLRTFLGPSISIIDLRPAAEYAQGHIPFSINVPAEVFRSNAAHPDKLANLLGPAGVNPAHEAVIVSGKGLTADSALAFVLLQKLGQNRTSLFLEPIDSWKSSDQALTKDATAVGAGKGPLSIPPVSYATKQADGVLLTGTDSSKGIYPKVFIASGSHAPAKTPDGAKVVHLPYTDLLNADGTPKPAKDIWTALEKAGVPRYAELICISDDAGEAAANYFTLKLMGFPDVKVMLL